MTPICACGTLVMSRRLEAAVCRRPFASGACGRWDDRPGGCGRPQDEALDELDDPDGEPEDPEPDDDEPVEPDPGDEPDDPEPDDEPEDPDPDPDDDEPFPEPDEPEPDEPEPDPPEDAGTVDDFDEAARESVR